MAKQLFSIKNADFADWGEWLTSYGAELIVFSLVFVFAVFAITPDDIPAGKYFACYFRKITGLDCPGCGLTRGFIALCHGNFAEAFSVNALTYLVAPFFAYRLLRAVSASVFGKYMEITLPLPAIISIVALAFVYAVGRIAIEIGVKFRLF